MKRTIKYSSDKVKGLLLGTFIGDSLGSAFDGVAIDEIPPLDAQYVNENPPVYYTDDTQMAISVFEEMLDHGRIETSSLVERFIRRFVPWRKYSGGMLEVIEKWRDGENPETAASTLYGGAGSFGNGAAMRVGPIAAFYALDEGDLLVEEVTRSAIVTHTHAYGIAGAILQSFAVLFALNDIPVDTWLERLFSSKIESAFKIKLQKVERCLQNRAYLHDSVKLIGNGSEALEAVPAAIYSVMRNTGSFSDAVLFAVGMGGDADTIGAMAGAISGACSGLKGIPAEWLSTLENDREGRDFISGLVDNAV